MGLIKAGIILGGIYLITKRVREDRKCNRSRNYHEDPSNTDPRLQNTQNYPPGPEKYQAPSQIPQGSNYRNEKQFYNEPPNGVVQYSEPKMIGETQRDVPPYDEVASNGWQRGQWQEKSARN